VRLFQSRQWQTNALVIERRDTAILVDPTFFREEIEAIAAAVPAALEPVVLLTHADVDHVCGIGVLPEARVVGGAATAGRIRSGATAREVARANATHGIDVPVVQRVDAILRPGRAKLGDLDVNAVETHGHAVDGMAYAVAGVLVAGDYASVAEVPTIWSSLRDAVGAIRRLLELLDEEPIHVVVPGHGPLLTPAEARDALRADDAYLRRLWAAARGAVAAGEDPPDALRRVLAVEPPRRPLLDLGDFDPREHNGRRALVEAAAVS
jgi:glyoxylase-like metal-dependent hydrolase (beta-lactamase superfamily II)